MRSTWWPIRTTWKQRAVHVAVTFSRFATNSLASIDLHRCFRQRVLVRLFRAQIAKLLVKSPDSCLDKNFEIIPTAAPRDSSCRRSRARTIRNRDRISSTCANENCSSRCIFTNILRTERRGFFRDPNTTLFELFLITNRKTFRTRVIKNRSKGEVVFVEYFHRGNMVNLLTRHFWKRIDSLTR